MATKDEDFVTRLFVANTHTALLVFTTEGMVYTLKTWRLPLAGRNARGKAIVNILPIPQGVSVAAILPVDVPEEEWASLQIMFATSDGDVRRNALDDFTNVMRNGKIAMKLPDGHAADQRPHLLRGRRRDADHHAAAARSASRRTDVRVFKGRDSTGVRGIRLAAGDEVVSMAVIRHFEATPEERAAYLKMRRAVAGAPEEEVEADEDGGGRRRQLRARPGPLRRDVRGRGPAPHRHRARRRQALVVATTTRCAAAAARASPRWTGRCAAARWSRCSRSSRTTRSCSPPTPASRSACRSPTSPSARAAPAACGSSTPPPDERVVSVALIAENGEEEEA